MTDWLDKRQVAGAECQMGDYPFVDLDEIMDIAPPKGGAVGVLKVAEEMGLQVTPSQQ